MDVQLKRGMLDICVLSVLLREDSYGYKIIKDLQPYVTISESTLYPILRRLETAACVTVYSTEHNGRLRKYYQITENGRAKISEFLEEWQGMMDIYKFIKKVISGHSTMLHIGIITGSRRHKPPASLYYYPSNYQ